MKPGDFIGSEASWADVMPVFRQSEIYDEDCPPLNFAALAEPVTRFKGRVIPSRRSPSDPFDLEVLEFMKSLNPLIEMEPDVLNGMPVFQGTRVPVKCMFEYLLAGRSIQDFLQNFPSVPGSTAIAVLENEATLFYEDISIAMDSAAMPSSRPR